MIGVQLYTLRDVLGQPPDVEPVLRRLAGAGCQGVEPYPPLVEQLGAERLAEQCRQAGLRVTSLQTGFASLSENPGLVAERCRTLDCQEAVVTAMPPGYRTPEGWLAFAHRLTALENRLSADGIALGYHNHRFEFVPEDGRTAYQVLHQEASSKLLWELDLGWVAAAGEDPAAWVDRLAGRVPVVHAKDVRGRGDEAETVEIGEGDVPWGRVLRACQSAGVRWYVIEQDRCARDPLACVELSATRLRAYLEEAGALPGGERADVHNGA